MTRRDELTDPIAEASRYRPSPRSAYPPSTLRSSYRPAGPPKPGSTEVAPEPLHVPPAAVQGPVVAAVDDEPPALLIQIDLRAWRTRWFWRLVGSMVVRRLGRLEAPIDRR